MFMYERLMNEVPTNYDDLFSLLNILPSLNNTI